MKTSSAVAQEDYGLYIVGNGKMRAGYFGRRRFLS